MWFFFLPLDYKGVEKRLNQYAASGWELAVERDGMAFRVPLQMSGRTDLQYCVCCDSLVNYKNLPEIVAEKQAQGWQSVATVNHFDIYASMPCQSPQIQAATPKPPLVRHALRTLMFFTLFAAFLVGVTVLNQIPLVNEWYLSNTGIFLKCAAPVVAVGTIYYLLWLVSILFTKEETVPTPFFFRLRSVLALCAAIFILLLTVTVVSDLVIRPWSQLLMILLFLGSILFCYLRFQWSRLEKRYSALSLIFALVLAMSLLIRGIMPSPNRAEMGDCLWRNDLPDIVSAEDVGIQTSTLEAASYEQSGSWWVTKRVYWESWPECSFSSTVYRCRGTGFQRLILSEQLESNDWAFVKSGYDQMWQTQRGAQYHVLIQQGNAIISLSSSCSLTALVDGTVQLMLG